ncbi:class I SAM-dependent methyltransferase [bacterium]|nr:class I SAM-dependent methyltransferase [bacterium]
MIETQESTTAKICSFVRAYHANFIKNKVFDDFFAFEIMGKDEYEDVKNSLVKTFLPCYKYRTLEEINNLFYPLINNYFAPILLSRIAFAEKEFKIFSSIYKNCQYVICGAGLDTFSLRNTNSNVRIFELDHPNTQKYKLERIYELLCNIPENTTFVPIDFEKENIVEILLKSGFDPKIPTFFSILGVTYYLSLETFEQTIKDISNLASKGSEVIFDYPDETTFSKKAAGRVQFLTKFTENCGEKMKHGFSFEEILNLLEKYNFSVIKHFSPKEIQKIFFEKTEHQAYENVHFIGGMKIIQEKL